MQKRLAVLASGTGSLFESILTAGIKVDLLVVDRECPAMEIARRMSVQLVHIPRGGEFEFHRDSYTKEVVQVLRALDIGLVAMAGFMTILGPRMFERDAFKLRTLNCHPSLLPAFKGPNAVRDAIRAGVKISGCTVHIATIQVDQGPILAQEPVRVFSEDTVESLHERIKAVERELYPAVLKGLIG